MDGPVHSHRKHVTTALTQHTIGFKSYPAATNFLILYAITFHGISVTRLTTARFLRYVLNWASCSYFALCINIRGQYH